MKQIHHDFIITITKEMVRNLKKAVKIPPTVNENRVELFQWLFDHSLLSVISISTSNDDICIKDNGSGEIFDIPWKQIRWVGTKGNELMIVMDENGKGMTFGVGRKSAEEIVDYFNEREDRLLMNNYSNAP